MKKWLLPFIGFVVLYLVFVISIAPINWFVAKVSLPKSVELGQVKGTLWHSSIDTLVVNNVTLTDVEAKLSLFSLLAFDPSLEISFGNPMLVGPEGSLTVSGLMADIKVQDAKITLPADTIAQVVQLPVPAIAHNRVHLDLSVFEQGAPLCSQVEGKITWQQAAVTSFDKRVELGDLSAQLSCQKGELSLKVVEGNSIGLTLAASVGAGFKTRVNGYVLPTSATPNEVIQALSFFGKPDREGRYPIRF